MSELDPMRPGGVRWELAMPSEPTPDQLAALSGLARNYGWVLEQRAMNAESARANTYFDPEHQAFLDTDLITFSDNLGEQKQIVKRGLRALALHGSPTIRAMFAFGRAELIDIHGVSEASAEAAVKIVEERLPGIPIPARQGDVETLARICPSLSKVPFVALRSCSASLLRRTFGEVQPSVADIIYKSRAELNLGRFHVFFDKDTADYLSIKGEALTFASNFVTAQQNLSSGSR